MTRKQFFAGALGLILYSLLWYILADGEGWLFAAPTVLLALVVARALKVPAPRLKLRELPGFLLFYLATMLAGAWDVARRAWHPNLPLKAAWVTGELHSVSPQVRALSSTLIGLLPGTLASHINGQAVVMHVLDTSQNWAETLARLEQHLDRLLAVEKR